MNIYKKLLGNSIIFAIGNLGSKLISIILVPLYTYYLTTSEYGMVDIVTITSNMLVPIFTLSIFDAVLRFVMDKNQQKDEIFTNALFISVIGSILVISMYPILKIMNVLDGLLGYTIVIMILQANNSLFSQFSRAIGRIKIFAINGMIMTIVIGLTNIIFLVNFNLGIQGYLLSIIIGNLSSILFLFFSIKIYKYVNFNKLNKNITQSMLKYSIPLIPNAFMWWIINASNRYFILFFVGSSANGLFAVANKIPSLLSILSTVFFQAWQLSAIEEYNSKNKARFFSEVFGYFSMTMLLGTSGIIVVLKIVVKMSLAPEYIDSWKIVPFLLLGVVFSSFSGFLGTNYIAAKQTNGVFRTSVIGGIINVISNIIFIPLMGTKGAGISTMISFFVIWILRAYDTKKFIDMNINYRNIIFNIIIIFTQIFILYLNLPSMKEILVELILFFILIIINKDLFKPLKYLIASKSKGE